MEVVALATSELLGGNHTMQVVVRLSYAIQTGDSTGRRKKSMK